MVKRAPTLVFLEIAWRWTFGLIATVLLLLGARAFLAGLKIAPGDEEAVRSTDVMRAFAALMHVFQQPGVWQRFLLIATAIVLPSTVLWIAAATLGRVAVLRRLLGLQEINALAVLGLNIARVVLLFVAIAVWYLWMFFSAFLAMTSDPPNYPLYVLLSFIALPVVAVLWGFLNWVLSLAPVLVARKGSSALQSYGETLALVRRKRDELFSVTSWLGTPRLAGMVILLLLAVIVLVAIKSALAATVILTLITLVYCACADYLYVVRLAAYSQIADTKVAAEAN